jgi:hypothetical protein
MVDRGADLRTVQTILGHTDISSTQIYLKVWPTLLHDELLRCHPRNNPKRAQIGLFAGTTPLPSPLVPRPCEECAAPALPGKSRCQKHVIRARIARKRHYLKTKKRAKAVAPQTKSARKAG